MEEKKNREGRREGTEELCTVAFFFREMGRCFGGRESNPRSEREEGGCEL
jgi:hypothetical protein